MNGAMYHKLNDALLWTGYHQGQTLVTYNILDYNGFEVVYDILSKIIPKLNINLVKSNIIQRPIYSDRDDDNIHSYVSAYNAFLKFEKLMNNIKAYISYKIVVCITPVI